MKYLFLLGLSALLACSAHAAMLRLNTDKIEDAREICPLESTDPNLNGMFDEFPESFEKNLELAMSEASISDITEIEADEAIKSREAREDDLALKAPVHFKPIGRYYDMCPEKVQYIRKYNGCWIFPWQRIRYVTCSRYCRFYKHMPCHGRCGFNSVPFWPSYRCLAERWYRQSAWALCPKTGVPFWAIKRISVWSPQSCCCHMWFPWFQQNPRVDYESSMASGNVAELCPYYKG